MAHYHILTITGFGMSEPSSKRTVLSKAPVPRSQKVTPPALPGTQTFHHPAIKQYTLTLNHIWEFPKVGDPNIVP